MKRHTKYVIDLEKSGNYIRGAGRSSHKYVKRTGSSGNYKYWYKLADGKMSTMSDDHQSQGKKDHAKRLMVNHLSGKSTMDGAARRILAEISRRTGVDVEGGGNLRNIWRNLQGGRHENSTYEDSHLEAKEQADHPEADSSDFIDHTNESHPNIEALRSEISSRASKKKTKKKTTKKTKKKTSRSTGERIAERETAARGSSESDLSDDEIQDTLETAAREETPPPIPEPRRADSPAMDEAVARLDSDIASKKKKKKVTKKKKTKKKVAKKVTKKKSREAIETNMDAASDEELLSYLTDNHDMNLQEVDEAKASVERIKAAKEAIATVEPEYESGADAAESMVAEQSSGGNPYLKRASDLYDSVKNHYENGTTSEKKHAEVTKHFFAAVKAVGPGEGGKYDEAAVLEKYKELSGSRVRGFSGIDKSFGTATGHTTDEILNNPQVDAATMATRAGYATKQFNRLKPFLKTSWVQSNENAPPPFPTFGDIQTWSQATASLGGEKPAWAGRTRLAVPKEVFDAAVKEDGKPKYPPAWMPIHMMPLWNYAVKSAGSNSAYASATSSLQNMPAAGDLGSVILNSFRRYVTRRGNDNLIDISQSKLREKNISEEELFRSELSDQEIHKIIATKHIPLEEIIPYIDEELGGDKMKKGFVSKTNLRKSKKHTKYTVNKSYKGTQWKKKGGLAGGASMTDSRRNSLSEQKKKYEAKKDLKEGRSDDYYKWRVAGNKPASSLSEKEDKKPKAERPEEGTTRQSGSSNHRDYLRRIGAIKSFVVKKNME